jgi:hypothetical protein
VRGSQFDTSFEVTACFGAVSDAGGPAGRFQVQEAQPTVWAGVVDGRVRSQGCGEGAFDAGNDAECTQGLGLGELSKVEGQEIVGLRALRIDGEGGVAGVHTRLGNPGAIPISGLCIGPIEGRMSETPQNFDCVRVFSPCPFCAMERRFESGAFRRGVVGGAESWEGEDREEDPSAAKQGWDGEMASFHLRFLRREHYTVLRLSK